jgi:hypothetical protein
MKWMRRDLPYPVCLVALVWLAASAFAVAPPNGSQCPGQALAAGGQSATLSCGGAVCHGTGNCTLGAAVALPVNETIQVYTFDGVAWNRAAGPPAGSTIAECVCKKDGPGGFTVYGDAACCHLVEVTHADGSHQVATRGDCTSCGFQGRRCFVTGQAGAPAIGEADCVN